MDMTYPSKLSLTHGYLKMSSLEEDERKVVRFYAASIRYSSPEYHIQNMENRECTGVPCNSCPFRSTNSYGEEYCNSAHQDIGTLDNYKELILKYPEELI